MLVVEGKTRLLAMTMEQAVVDAEVIFQKEVEEVEQQQAVMLMLVQAVGMHQRWWVPGIVISVTDKNFYMIDSASRPF